MYCLEDLKYNKLYKKRFFLPYIKEDKKHGSAILLLTPNYSYSNALMNNQFTINKNFMFSSYYIERDIMYTINHESRNLEITHEDPIEFINEGTSTPFIETTDIKIYDNLEDSEINELYCRLGDHVIFFNEMYDEDILDEAVVGGYNSKYKRMLYNDRLRNNKAVFQLYDPVKKDNPWIRRTFVNYNRYHKFNLFIDLYYYNQAYLSNNSFTITKSIDMYFEFVSRFINDKRITDAGYKRRTVFVPIDGWNKLNNTRLYDYRKNLNPISAFMKRIRLDKESMSRFKGIDFIFFGATGYFKMDYDHLDNQSYNKYIRFFKLLEDRETFDDDNDEEENTSSAIATDIISTIEKNKNVEIQNLTGKITAGMDKKELTKAQLVKKINDASTNAKDTDETLNRLDKDPEVKKLIIDLEDDSDSGRNLSAGRSSRIDDAQNKFMQQRLNNKSVKDMITESNKTKELKEESIPIKTINDEWHHMKAVNFEKEYDLEADIIKCLNSLSDKNKMYPVSILSVNSEDTSTSEDSVYTYTVKCEDIYGKRFTLRFDIPKFRDNRFMRLRGNEKIFSIEMPLLPISKTDDDTSQIVSFYNKIFVRRYNTSAGKSNPYSDRLIKALTKYKGNGLKIIIGDNSRVCTKYELPIDYIDIASLYSKIIYYSDYLKENVTLYFNQDEIRRIPGVNPRNGLPLGMSDSGKVLYYTGKAGGTVSQYIANSIEDKAFRTLYDKQTTLRKATYSRASILNTDIPIIVILAHDLGLTKAMDLAGINYTLEENATKDFDKDSIKFKDGCINYVNTYDSMMIMNGLKDCSVEDMSIKDINKKSTWVAQLENFGGRNKSDGLDNFRDLMYDPITIEVSKDYKLPTDYHEALIYASNLLVDNKFIKHTNIKSNRYRTNEVVAALFYKALGRSYIEYASQLKRGRKVPMTMKQSVVLDLVLSQNTTSDLSVFQPLLEIETKNTISTKGASGMNSDRAYKLDKRGYDTSMVNVIAQATGFAKTVGVNRSTTLNPGIEGGRGYFKQSEKEEMNVTNTYNMTEALSPFTVTSDDPFRNNMTYVQTSKHSTPIENGTPLLVTTGADSAMPYMTSDMFAHKAKRNGVVREMTSEYMIVDYTDGSGESEFVDLSEQTKKNSDGGFYITLQLKTDLKVGQSVKAGEILAYDKKSFSNKIGHGMVSYNVGALTKFALLTTEDGFEDSGVCSEWLSHTMASSVVVMKDVALPAMTNVLYIAKKGQEIREGEPILIFQNAFDEEDANMLLKNLNIEDGDLSTIGRNVIKSKVTGVLQDIKIYRTCELNEMSDSLKKIVMGREKEIKRIKSIAEKSNNDVYFDAVGKLPQLGKTKNLDNGVLIELYMRYFDELSTGDKCSSTANKCIIMNVFSDAEAPYTDFRKNEAIDMLQSASSLDGRMITSIFKTGALNKLLIELQRKCCEIYNEPWQTLHDISNE